MDCRRWGTAKLSGHSLLLSCEDICITLRNQLEELLILPTGRPAAWCRSCGRWHHEQAVQSSPGHQPSPAPVTLHCAFELRLWCAVGLACSCPIIIGRLCRQSAGALCLKFFFTPPIAAYVNLTNQPILCKTCVCEIYLVELIILDTTKTVVCSLIRLIKWLSHPGAWHGLICPGLSDGFSFGIPLFVPQGPFLHTYLRLWPQDSGETGLLHKHLLPGNIFGKPYFHVPRA